MKIVGAYPSYLVSYSQIGSSYAGVNENSDRSRGVYKYKQGIGLEAFPVIYAPDPLSLHKRWKK